jgi:hypothetical protein
VIKKPLVALKAKGFRGEGLSRLTRTSTTGLTPLFFYDESVVSTISLPVRRRVGGPFFLG